MSKKCTPLCREEAHVEVKMYKTPRLRSTFGSRDVQKVDAVVVRSTFGSENVQSMCKNSRGLDHFWTIRLPFDVEKVHAVAARSIGGSQTCQKLRVVSFKPILRCQMSFC